MLQMSLGRWKNKLVEYGKNIIEWEGAIYYVYNKVF